MYYFMVKTYFRPAVNWIDGMTALSVMCACMHIISKIKNTIV